VNPVKLLRLAATGAVMLALLVVMLGASTRLTNAGLGCPDWPGCYGHMVLPMAKTGLAQAQNHYPHTPIETVKAWTEMVHRYAAGTLALFIFGMTLAVSRMGRPHVRLPWMLPLTLLLLVSFQAALGMWTVTLKLLPVVVMGHLLGGILIFACLGYFRWQLSSVRGRNLPGLRALIGVGILIVFCQIALGGWVSSNYAGIACIGFPRCNGQWLPVLHLSQAFNLFSSVGANYQGGVLDHDARMTIQIIHRLGAYLTAAYVLLLTGFVLKKVKAKPLRNAAWVAMMLVVMQFTLGIINVAYLLPLWAAVAHNGVAALLLSTMVSMYYFATNTKGVVHAEG
jgi:cytochrome c oxidase assembly protein subunit 15